MVLLRGINLGAWNKIAMADLRDPPLRRRGRDQRRPERQRRVRRGRRRERSRRIKRDLGLDIAVLLSAAELDRLVARNPFAKKASEPKQPT